MDLIVAVVNIVILLWVIITLNSIQAEAKRTRQLLAMAHLEELLAYASKRQAILEHSQDKKDRQAAEKELATAQRVMSLQ